MKINDPKRLNRRELTGCLLTCGLAVPTAVAMGGTRSIRWPHAPNSPGSAFASIRSRVSRASSSRAHFGLPHEAGGEG